MLRTMLIALLLLSGCGDDGGLKVTRVSPKEGPYQGGDPVTISGSGFEKTRPSKVYFNDREGRIISVEDEAIKVEPPGGNLNEKVTIKIVFDDSRRKELKDIYTYIEPGKGFDVDGLTGGDKDKKEAPK
jgi:hypothetical protein